MATRTTSVSKVQSCSICGKPLKDKVAFKTNSSLHSNSGFMSICKGCLEEQYRMFIMMYHDDKMAIQRICMLHDIYYSDQMYYSCAEKGGTVSISQYMQKANLMNNRGKTFEDSLTEGFTLASSGKGFVIGLEESKGEKLADPRLVDKWGSGLEVDDYEQLESHYKQLKTLNPKIDPNQEIFINDLCYTKAQQMKAYREGRIDDYNKLTESYRKTFVQAGLKAVKESASDEDFKFGVNVETIEKFTPAEYYKNKSLFKDHDNIGDYFTRFVLRPLRNLQHGTQDRDEEFYVKDEEDIDGSDGE